MHEYTLYFVKGGVVVPVLFPSIFLGVEGIDFLELDFLALGFLDFDFLAFGALRFLLPVNDETLIH